jgi:hypothetical protein
MDVYKISPARAFHANLQRKLKTWKYSTLKEAVSALKNACEENGWKLKTELETTEDNCLAFRNEDDIEIARIMPEPGPRWAGEIDDQSRSKRHEKH